MRVPWVIIMLMGAVSSADESHCVSNYQKLERIFTKSDENYGNLSEAFFTTNRISSHYVTVNYRMMQCDNEWQRDGNNTGCVLTGTERWIWSYSMVHILFHPYSLNYLSFWYDNTDKRVGTVTLTLPALCQNQKDHLLSRITQLLSKYAKSREEISFDENDNLGRSYNMDEVYEKFNKARIFCICSCYCTALAVLLITIQIVSRPNKKVNMTPTPAKYTSILYSFSLAWLIDIIWIIYLDYVVLINHTALDTPNDIHSRKFIYFIVIADYILVAVVLIITPFLCKHTFFQRSCKLGNNYVTASKEYLVISSFIMFAVIHANHLVFILFGFLVEPIHALAKLIDFITTVAYFVSIFHIIFHHHRKYNDGRKNRILHYAKLAFKLTYFYLYFLVLYFTFSYLFYDDLMITPYQCLIKSLSVSALIWLVIISIHFSHRWLGTMDYITLTTTGTTTTTTTTARANNGVTKSKSRSVGTDHSRVGHYELRELTESTIDSTVRSDQEPLIDATSDSIAV